MTEPEATFIHRTFEPFAFLGRLTFIPLRTTKGVPPVTFTATHEAEPPYRYAPTVVVRFWPFTVGLGIGWWRDSGWADAEARQEAGEEEAEYLRYTAVNGEVDKSEFQAARRQVAQLGLSPDEEMELLQRRGLFE